MDKQKKSELAEMDGRWNFEKQIQVPVEEMELDWDAVRSLFNNLQDGQGDLYMKTSSLPMPKRLERLKVWNRNRKQDGQTVTFHHSQVYNFYLKLANKLDTSVGEAVRKVLLETEELRKHFDLGKEVNVSINNVEAMDTSDTSVSRSELEELIEDE